MGMSKDQQSFKNLSLSFRGAERQPPSVLQMALRFSVIIDRQASSMTGNTEARLKKVIQQFNGSAGLHVKHQVDSEKERTILNLIIGTSKALVCFKKNRNCWNVSGRCSCCFLKGGCDMLCFLPQCRRQGKL